MDPHLYFEKKYSAEIIGTESSTVVLELIDSLSVWLVAADFRPDQLMQLDRELAARGLPSIGLMQSALRPAALVLVRGGAVTVDEIRSLRLVTDDALATAADRVLAHELLAER